MSHEYTPNWFSKVMPDSLLNEKELKERLEYETIQLEMLRLDFVNTEVRIALLKDMLEAGVKSDV